ncbi:MAG: hypothetical protein ACRDSJ_11430 [Rubrobacteraceae bacterium]
MHGYGSAAEQAAQETAAFGFRLVVSGGFDLAFEQVR